MKQLFLIKNNDDKYIFVKSLVLSIVLNFSLYIYMPYVMDIFFNLNYHYTPILESNGRNLRIILDNIITVLFSSFMVPYVSLIISSIIYAYSFMLLYKYLNFDSVFFKKLLPYTVILPCFTMLNPFFHDLPYYALNFLLSIISVLVLTKFKSNIKYVLFVLVNIFTLFIYQLNFFFIPSLLLFDVIKDILDNKDFKIIIRKLVYYLLSIIITIIIYFIVLKIININMNTREAKFSIFNFIKTFAAFLILPFKSYMQINDLLISRLSIFFIYLIILYMIISIFINNSYNIKYKFLLLLLIIIFPISMNSVLLILKNPSRAMFAELYLIIVPCYLLSYTNINLKFNKIINIVFLISITILLLTNFYTANARYLELKNRSEAEKSWTIELVSSIRQTEGYNTNSKIAFLTEIDGNIDDNNLLDYYEDYNHNRFGTEYASSILKFNYGEGLDLALKYYGAFKYNNVTKEEIELIKNKEEYKNMPIYPNYGSIKNIDDIIVVKFN